MVSIRRLSPTGGPANPRLSPTASHSPGIYRGLSWVPTWKPAITLWAETCFSVPVTACCFKCTKSPRNQRRTTDLKLLPSNKMSSSVEQCWPQGFTEWLGRGKATLEVSAVRWDPEPLTIMPSTFGKCSPLQLLLAFSPVESILSFSTGHQRHLFIWETATFLSWNQKVLCTPTAVVLKWSPVNYALNKGYWFIVLPPKICDDICNFRAFHKLLKTVPLYTILEELI